MIKGKIYNVLFIFAYMRKVILLSIFLLIGILVTSCKKDQSYVYDFVLVNETGKDLYVSWSIDGNSHLDTIPSSTISGIPNVSHGFNSNSDIEFNVLNSMYNCTIVSSDSSRVWDVSDLTEYSVFNSKEPLMGLFFEKYTFAIQ
jgi:hypothetical protein